MRTLVSKILKHLLKKNQSVKKKPLKKLLAKLIVFFLKVSSKKRKVYNIEFHEADQKNKKLFKIFLKCFKAWRQNS